MKPEPLKGKMKIPCDPNFFPEDYFFMKKDIQSAVHFYALYSNHPEWLKKEHKRLWSKFRKSQYWCGQNIEDRTALTNFNKWLLGLAFEDVI